METGDITKLDRTSSFEKVAAICAQFSDTAGIFFPVYQSLKKSCEGKTASKDLYSRESRELWRPWGKHKVGKAKYCVYSHPYSTSIFRGCLECGRKVEPKKQSEAVDCGKNMFEDAFIAQMNKMSGVNGKAVTITGRSGKPRNRLGGFHFLELGVRIVLTYYSYSRPPEG